MLAIPLANVAALQSPTPQRILHTIHTFRQLKTIMLQTYTGDERMHALMAYLALHVSKAVTFELDLIDEPDIEVEEFVGIKSSLINLDSTRIRSLSLDIDFLDKDDHIAILSLASLRSLRIVSKRIYVPNACLQMKGPPNLLDLSLHIEKDNDRPKWASILQLTKVYCMSLQSLDIIVTMNFYIDTDTSLSIIKQASHMHIRRSAQ